MFLQSPKEETVIVKSRPILQIYTNELNRSWCWSGCVARGKQCKKDYIRISNLSFGLWKGHPGKRMKFVGVETVRAQVPVGHPKRVVELHVWL